MLETVAQTRGGADRLCLHGDSAFRSTRRILHIPLRPYYPALLQ